MHETTITIKMKTLYLLFYRGSYDKVNNEFSNTLSLKINDILIAALSVYHLKDDYDVFLEHKFTSIVVNAINKIWV